MRRLPAVAFALLAAATVGAFFLVDHLKTSNPLIFGTPKPTPAAFNPVAGRVCRNIKHQPLSYRKTTLTFSVGRAGSVGVYIVSANHPNGDALATITSGTQMKAGYFHPHTFSWDGRLTGGRVAPQGGYLFRIEFNGEGTTVDLSQSPVRVVTAFPHPRVQSVQTSAGGGVHTSAGGGVQTSAGGGGQTSVSGSGQTRASGRHDASVAVIAPPQGEVKIHFTAGAGVAGPPRRVWLDVYRTDLPGPPRFVTQLAVNPTTTVATWNGEIDGRPAPAGIYRVGITAQDAACDQSSNHAATVGTGLTVRYLSVTPPLIPVVAGSDASVAVDSPLSGFTWKLRHTGGKRVLARGTGVSGQSQVTVPLPARRAGLYTLTVNTGTTITEVPIVASAAGRTGVRARVLVVLPMLSWLGQSDVDDSGDGLPSTLAAGDGVSLARPLVGWPGASALDDSQLLSYLNAQHDGYQLTTDVALSQGVGPSLVDRWGVLLPDGFDYLPVGSTATEGLGATLSGFVQGGGRALVLGTGVLAGTTTVTDYPSNPQASAPRLSDRDLFGAQRGSLSSTGGALIVSLQDQLHVFGVLSALTGFSAYQPIEPPASAGTSVSAFGVADGSPAVAVFPVGKGTAVEVGLPDFGTSLAGNVDSQELLDSIWPLLSNRG